MKAAGSAGYVVFAHGSSIESANDAVRAVAVDAGRHRIEFRFRPGSVYWGAAFCALGIILTLCLWASDRAT